MIRGRIILLAAALGMTMNAAAQDRKVQHRPYTDLRPLHFGIHVGINTQDIELQNVGPQTITLEDGTQTEQTIVTDADRWNSGFSVGVLADLRLSQHFNLRFSPTMHFGAKHLIFHNLDRTDSEGRLITATQDMKNTYIAFPVDLKFSAERFNNYRPYLIGGVSPMINLTGKHQDFIQLKRADVFMEIGIGCDLYLPFFKLIPELKFCYSLTDALDHNHINHLEDTNKHPYTNAVTSGHSKMIVLTFYFE